ncbi:DNA polymerase III subunit beta [bacterium]|nr:DNA polymerase III subunit beta [bacterium]
MRFTAKTGEILKVIQFLTSVVPTRTTIEILNNILFELKGNTLRLSATDTEIFQVFSLEVDGKKDGSVTIPAKTLSNFLREINDEVIVFEAVGARISLETKQGKFQLSGESAENFPLIPMVEDSEELEISYELFNKIINKVSFAVSNDSLRQALRGILLELSEKGVTFVATDGTKLSKYFSGDVKFSGTEKSVIIPTKAFSMALKNVEGEGSFKLLIAKQHFVCKTENSELYSRIIDDQYPDYKRVIPTDNDKILTVSVSKLISGLKRISILANSETHQVKIDLSENSVQLVTENPQTGSFGQETIDCVYENAEIEVGFNATILLDTLRQIETENVVLNLKQPTSAVLVLPEKTEKSKDDFFMIAMPIRINS